jgi:hypothetical protein
MTWYKPKTERTKAVKTFILITIVCVVLIASPLTLIVRSAAHPPTDNSQHYLKSIEQNGTMYRVGLGDKFSAWYGFDIIRDVFIKQFDVKLVKTNFDDIYNREVVLEQNGIRFYLIFDDLFGNVIIPEKNTSTENLEKLMNDALPIAETLYRKAVKFIPNEKFEDSVTFAKSKGFKGNDVNKYIIEHAKDVNHTIDKVLGLDEKGGNRRK